MATDPVCKMHVDEATAQWSSEFKGKTYYSCAAGCKQAFDSDPRKYTQEDEEVHLEGHGHPMKG